MPETAVVVTVGAAAPIVETPPGGIPAHVTLLYPFVDGALIEGVVDDLRAELSRFPAFALTLHRLDRFGGPPTVVYAVPEPQQAFVAITEALTKRFGIQPYGGVHSEVIPHLTIAIADDPAALDVAEADAVRLLPIADVVDVAELWQHDPDGWRRLHTIPLGE